MTNSESMPNNKMTKCSLSNSTVGLRHSFVIGHWSLVILTVLAVTSCLTNITRAAQESQQQIAACAGLEQKLNAQVPLDTVFRDEHGHAVPLRNFFHGKPVIFALAYYECPNLCTLVLNGVLQTAQELKFDAGQEYEIVVLSFDSRER